MEAQTKVTLTVIQGPEEGKIFEFTEQDNFLLGRDAEGSHAHFRLSPEDTYVSRNHFLLDINPPDCYLRDAGSLNGTFVIRKKGKSILFFLEGREEKGLESAAKHLAKRFQCESYQKGEEWIRLEDGDLIKVGETIVKVQVQEISKEAEISNQAIQADETFRCIKCGKDIADQIRAKEAQKLISGDFLCKECQAKQKKDKEALPGEEVKCWGCNKDLTSMGNSDGRAFELKDIALYWCRDCALSEQGKVPVSRIGNYHILKELGSGGFGVVYLAWDETTGRIVALKLTREKIKRNKRLLERFKREITIMKELDHPHLVRLYDEGISEEESYYFVSEYLPEGSLADLLKKKYNGMIPYKEACYLIFQALDGLSYFHNFGEQYVHRDLKPENVLLDFEGHLKLSDFGLSKEGVSKGKKKAFSICGTPDYLAPEIIEGIGHDKAVDWWSLGVLLYEMLVGCAPFYHRDRIQLLNNILHKDLSGLSNYHGDWFNELPHFQSLYPEAQNMIP